MQLILFTRENCCLCKGVEEKLSKISLDNLNPSLEIDLVDIDSPLTPLSYKSKYDYEVPVLAIKRSSCKHIIELPRFSPRLQGPALFNWLQNQLNNIENIQL
tara:strand:- start:6120 stop:6425 length:306 start_codon:yes stop_codon:yes gene_type:complete